MRKATILLAAMAIAAAMWQTKAGATGGPDDPVLQSAKITFSLPRGDDKDDNTAIDVVVSTRVNGQWEEVIAGLEDFANQEVWEDDGAHSYPYDLRAMSGITKNVLRQGGVKTQINWKPVGNDRGFFNYTLTLRFNDGSEIKQSNSGLIEMSQDRRTYTNP